MCTYSLSLPGSECNTIAFNPCFTWSSLYTDSGTYITHTPNSAISKINLIGKKRHHNLYILRNKGFKKIHKNKRNGCEYCVSNPPTKSQTFQNYLLHIFCCPIIELAFSTNQNALLSQSITFIHNIILHKSHFELDFAQNQVGK